MKILFFQGLILGVIFLLFISFGWILHSSFAQWQNSLTTDNQITQIFATPVPTPLVQYSFPELQKSIWPEAEISVNQDEVEQFEKGVTRKKFSAIIFDKKMSGVITIPNNLTINTPIVLMLRGWAPKSSYISGTGTNNASKFYAENGYLTIAPDFFGYGDSDPEPIDTWQARFEKPLIALAFIETIEKGNLEVNGLKLSGKKIALWGHSNGGQIALSSLAISKKSIPTTLWAPVTAPFPYSILYYSDEEVDEGKATRKWLALFEDVYDAREFSVTQYLSDIQAPLQLHQGNNDDAVLKWWSDEFVQKIDRPVKYFIYNGADHNLTPGWDLVVQRDLEFFAKELNTSQAD